MEKDKVDAIIRRVCKGILREHPKDQPDSALTAPEKCGYKLLSNGLRDHPETPFP